MSNPLDPYVPGTTRPWNKKMVLHLLNRTTFGAKVSDVNTFLSYTPDQAVEKLFETYAIPPAPNTWVTDPPDPNAGQINNQNSNELRRWWVKQMYSQPANIRELMTFFWHNHFTSAINTIRIPQYMYTQNQLIRQYALGNVKTFALQITRDPAMLIYLDGRLNTVGNPNENYSRELLELFTLGIGNYTEFDIQEGARALTGWSINGLLAQYYPARHDNTNKTYLGQTGNWGDTDVINIIFQHNACAVFICTKLYKFFINETADMSYALPVINQLADILRTNNYEIAPVLKVLLKSDLFFSENVMGSLIKSPLQLMINQLRQMSVTLNSSTIDTNITYLIAQASAANQFILDPPSVQGWLGYRTWLNTLSMPVRNSYSESVVTGIKKDNTPTGFSVDVLTFANLFPFPNDAVKLVKDISEHLIRVKVAQKQLDYLLLVLLDGAAVYDWDINDPLAATKLKKFLKALIYLAEYQLN